MPRADHRPGDGRASALDLSPQPEKFSLWPDVAVAAYSALFFVWLALPGKSDESRELIDNLFFVPPALAVAWASWRTARVWRRDAATQRGWSLLAWAAVVYWLGSTPWSGLFILAPKLIDTFWAESLSLPSYPLVFLAVLSFPGVYRNESSRARFLLDVALIFVGSALASWYFTFLRMGADVPHSGRQYSALIYPSADLLLMVAIGVAFLRAAHPTTRRALGWLLAGRTVKVCASIWYTLLGHGSGYYLGHPVDALWFTAWLLAWVGARVPQHRLASGATDLEQEQRRTYRSGALPVLSVLFGQGLLLWLLRAELQTTLGVIALATTVLTLLIALRQMAELSENRRLRERERRQEARFRSLVQHGSDILLVVGGGGVLLYRSPSAERLTLRPSRDGASLAALFDDADAAALRALIERLEPGRTGGPVPARLLRDGDKVMHVEFLATDLRHDPAVGGVVLTGRDVSERHELEGELRHAEKLRAVGLMAGSVAHDFNNVLFVVSGNAALLVGRLRAGTPAHADALEIERAVERAAVVTRKLLQFSRRDISQPVVLDLNAVVAELEPMLRQFISSGIDVRFEYAPGPAPVVIDRGQLEQVLLNLAMNARDAMPGGGVLRLRIGPDGSGNVVVEVQDTGVGMDEDTRSRLFEPFFTTKPQGTGLGLATVYGIVTGAGGRLQVDSVPGHGTLFTMRLPRAVAARPGS